MSADSHKLFVTAQEESLGFAPQVRRIFEESSQPKDLKTYPGRAHAQHMFKQSYGDRLRALALDFLGN